MSTTEAILEKVSALPPEKQERVLEFVESISREGKTQPKSGRPYEWLDIALKANLQDPPDWSANLDAHLYGGKRNALRPG